MTEKQKKSVDNAMKEVYRVMLDFDKPKDEGIRLVLIRNIINVVYTEGFCDGIMK